MKNYAKTDSNNIIIIFCNISAYVGAWIHGAARAPPFIVTVRRKPPELGRLILNEGRADSIGIAPRRFGELRPNGDFVATKSHPCGDFGDVVNPAEAPAAAPCIISGISSPGVSISNHRTGGTKYVQLAPIGEPTAGNVIYFLPNPQQVPNAKDDFI